MNITKYIYLCFNFRRQILYFFPHFIYLINLIYRYFTGCCNRAKSETLLNDFIVSSIGLNTDSDCQKTAEYPIWSSERLIVFDPLVILEWSLYWLFFIDVFMCNNDPPPLQLFLRFLPSFFVSLFKGCFLNQYSKFFTSLESRVLGHRMLFTVHIVKPTEAMRLWSWAIWIQLIWSDK